MQIVLDSYGLILGVRNKCFIIKSGGVEKMISPHRVTALLIIKNCRLSSRALQLAAQHEIAVLITDATGKVAVKTWSGQYKQQALLRRRQIQFVQEPGCTEYVKNLLLQKAGNQLEHIGQLIKNQPAQFVKNGDKIREAIKAGMVKMQLVSGLMEEQANALRGQEAITTRYYWLGLQTAVKPVIECRGRSKRPAKDQFNALVNYNYGLLYGKIETAVHTLGLDPHFGFFHINKYNSKTLVFDMIEPFRPWADEMLMEICGSNEHKANWFEEKNGGWWLAQPGRRLLITRFNEWWNQKIKYNGAVTTRNNHVLREVQQLVRKLTPVV